MLDPADVLPLGPAPPAQKTVVESPAPSPARVPPAPPAPPRKEKARPLAPPPPPEPRTPIPDSVYEADSGDLQRTLLAVVQLPQNKRRSWPHLLLPAGVLFVLILAFIHDACLADREKPVNLLDANPRLALRP